MITEYLFSCGYYTIFQEEKVRSINTVMKAFLMTLALLLLASCHNASTTQNEIQVGNDNKHSVKVNLRYAEPIDGFTVTATCFVDTIHNYDSPNTKGNRNAIVGKAYIYFRNDSAHFTIENPLFSDSTLMANNVPLTEDVTIKAKYTHFQLPENGKIDLLNYHKSPFFLYDIDFDGEQELIITLWEGMEYHLHHSYAVYKVRNTNTDKILQPLTTPPFDKINDYTLINTVAKTISICKGVDAMKIEGYSIYKFGE